MSKKKEETLCKFEKAKLTDKAAQEYKRIQRESIIRPLLRTCVISSIGWGLVILFLYYYLPELFENESQWLKIAMAGPGSILLIFLFCLLHLRLDSFSKSRYVITDKVIKYISSINAKIIRWKDIDGYKIEDKRSLDDDTLTVLLYRNNKRVNPFIIVVPQAYVEKVMGLIEERVGPLREVLPDLKSESIRKEKDFKSMLFFSLIFGVLAGILFKIEHFRLLFNVRGLAKLLFFTVGPGTLWILLCRTRKISDGSYWFLALTGNMIGNLIMLFILAIRHFRDMIDKAG
jgi:H+/Cl- antiporter ClcA